MAAGNYGQSAPDTPGLTSIAAHLQDRDGNYYQQTLATSEGPVDAGAFGGFDVTFDYAYRNDTATAGDIYLRVSLWDTTADSEIVGQTLTIVDTGVLPDGVLQSVHDHDDHAPLRPDRARWSRRCPAVYPCRHERGRSGFADYMTPRSCWITST